VLFQISATQESYDFERGGVFKRGQKTRSYSAGEQIDRVVGEMDKGKTTLVVQHCPLTAEYCGKYFEDASEENSEGKIEYSKIMKGIPEGFGAIFSGHRHKEKTKEYTFNGVTYTDHTAPYASVFWDDERENRQDGDRIGYSKPDHEAGVHAILVSPTRGVLQVKVLDIMPPCWERGTKCKLGLSCETECCRDSFYKSYWWSKKSYACGFEALWEDGKKCGGGSCARCKKEATYWHGKTSKACGKETPWKKNKKCVPLFTCKACKNGWKLKKLVPRCK